MVQGTELKFGNVPTQDTTPGIRIVDKKYLESGSWKCSDSPTGAHHWIIKRIKTGKIMICKYCKNLQRLPQESSPNIRSNKGSLSHKAKRAKLQWQSK